jgi:hypothetical protein
MPVPGGHVSVAIERSVTPTAITMTRPTCPGSLVLVVHSGRAGSGGDLSRAGERITVAQHRVLLEEVEQWAVIALSP